MVEAPLELDELELPPMFGQFPCFCPGVAPGVVVPGVVLGVVVGLGVVVEWPLAAYATPPPTLSAAATAATATVRAPTNPNLLFRLPSSEQTKLGNTAEFPKDSARGKNSGSRPVYWARVRHWLGRVWGTENGRAGLAAILGGSQQGEAALLNVSGDNARIRTRQEEHPAADAPSRRDVPRPLNRPHSSSGRSEGSQDPPYPPASSLNTLGPALRG